MKTNPFKSVVRDIVVCFGSLLFVVLAGCATLTGKTQGPKKWAVYSFVPKYSPTIVGDFFVADTKDYLHNVLSSNYPSYGNDPYSFKGGFGYAGFSINTPNLPKEIWVVWMPLATQVTYSADFIVPQWVRDKMKVLHHTKCGYYNPGVLPYNNQLLLGLAPDGTVKVFLNGSCDPKQLVMTVKGEATTEFDKDTKYNTSLELKDFPEAAAWIKKHGIPKGPW